MAMRSLTRQITVIMLALTLGLHWTVLQSVAWMGMLIRYSSQGTVSEAIIKTFDGNHPCSMCLAVAKGKDTEKEQKKLKGFEKFDGILPKLSKVILDMPVKINIPLAVDDPCQSIYPPPSPPPKVA